MLFLMMLETASHHACITSTRGAELSSGPKVAGVPWGTTGLDAAFWTCSIIFEYPHLLHSSPQSTKEDTSITSQPAVLGTGNNPEEKPCSEATRVSKREALSLWQLRLSLHELSPSLKGSHSLVVLIVVLLTLAPQPGSWDHRVQSSASREPRPCFCCCHAYCLFSPQKPLLSLDIPTTAPFYRTRGIHLR